MEFLILLGVLKTWNFLKWGALSFAQPKSKTNQIHFPSDFINLNKKLKRKPYPMPDITEMLLKLEGFQDAKTLGLNIGYDYIQLI